MVVHPSNLYHLFALPARGQHWALFPVMNVDGIFIEILIVLSAEITRVLVQILRPILLRCLTRVRNICRPIVVVRTHCLRIVLLLRCCLLSSRSLTFGLGAFNWTASGPTWVDISLDHFLSLLLLNRSLPWLVATICFSQLGLNLIDLGLAQTSEVTAYFVTKQAVKFNDTLLSRLAYVL